MVLGVALPVAVAAFRSNAFAQAGDGGGGAGGAGAGTGAGRGVGGEPVAVPKLAEALPAAPEERASAEGQVAAAWDPRVTAIWDRAAEVRAPLVRALPVVLEWARLIHRSLRTAAITPVQ